MFRKGYRQMDDYARKLQNERARMRQFMQPGKGYRVGFWRRIARAILRGIT